MAPSNSYDLIVENGNLYALEDEPLERCLNEYQRRHCDNEL
jgi:hypothetical protein